MFAFKCFKIVYKERRGVYYVLGSLVCSVRDASELKSTHALLCSGRPVKLKTNVPFQVNFWVPFRFGQGVNFSQRKSLVL